MVSAFETRIKRLMRRFIYRVVQTFIFYFSLINKRNSIIMYIPANNMISGGILSIYSLYYVSKSILKNSSVFICTSSEQPALRKYDWFMNNVNLIKLNVILNNLFIINDLVIHLPECFISDFLDNLTTKQIDKLKAVRNLQINVMNQNNELMPTVTVFDNLKKLTNTVTITAAHKQYANKKLSQKYQVPVHYLSAWFEQNSLLVEHYSKKKDILIVSPDEHPRKTAILNKIKYNLPHIKQVIVKGMQYDDYKLLEKQAKWSLSFGEGFDGYTIFPVLKGGISFAVYNETFFDSAYEKFPNFYKSYDEMEKTIVEDIMRYDNMLNYSEYNNILRSRLEQDYSYQAYTSRVKDFYNKHYFVFE